MEIGIVDITFIIIGTSLSFFYGLFCRQIWFPNTTIKDSPQNNLLEITEARYIHERWFNFISSVVGWVIIYILYKSLFINWPFLVNEISSQHIVLFLIGILGITGLLPYTLWSISRAPDELIKLIQRIFK